MNIFNKIDLFCAKYNLIPEGSTIIVGLSGGPDSVFLLYYMHNLHTQGKISLIAAHLDHQWRATSEKDLTFCKKMAESFSIPFVSAQLNDLPQLHVYNGSKEELARNKRREFFETVRSDYNADLVALAHHADDQQETFFIRLIRGATLNGLTAMSPQQGFYIRPLLETFKKDIMAFLAAQNIPYVIDATNTSDDFLRNRIRNHVIPALRQCDSRFDSNFEHALHSLQETDTFLDDLSHQTFSTITTMAENSLTLEIAGLLQQHPVLQYRLILLWLCQARVPFTPTRSFFKEIMRFLKQSGNKKHHLNTQWYIVKKNGRAQICFL